MTGFWEFLFALLAFNRIKEIRDDARIQSPMAITLMPRRWCARCSDYVYLDADMVWKHLQPTNHPATPLLSSDEGEPMPDDPDEWEDPE